MNLYSLLSLLFPLFHGLVLDRGENRNFPDIFERLPHGLSMYHRSLNWLLRSRCHQFHRVPPCLFLEAKVLVHLEKGLLANFP